MNIYDVLLAKQLGGGGGITPSGTLPITSNGIFNVTSYASASVSVPGIVPSGTSYITSNGIYDITNYASVDVNVSGGGGTDTLNAYFGNTLLSFSNSTATSILGSFFLNKSALTNVTFDNVTTINNSAFKGCTGLVSVNFPKAEIASAQAFMNCTSLTDISFPSCRSAGVSAFCGCTSLSNVSMPKLATVSSYAFSGCTNLETFNAPVTQMQAGPFARCFKLKSVVFPSLNALGTNTFQSCSALSYASFNKITAMGSQTFQFCSSLENIYILTSTIPTLNAGYKVFDGTPIENSSYLGHFGSIYVLSSMVDTFKAAVNWSAYSNRITAYVE